MKKSFLFFLMLSFCVTLHAQKTESSSWYVKGYTEEIAKAYFNSRYSLDLIEGIWQSTDGFKYAIERDVENGKRTKDTYRVIVLESSHDGWDKSEIKGFITYSSINGIYSFKYYTKNVQGSDISSQNVLIVVEDSRLLSFNRIDGGGKIGLFKLYPQVSGDESKGTGNLSSDKRWSGSAIVIGDRFLATNHHVVDGAKTLAVSSSSDNYTANYAAEVIVTDEANDLAIIKVIDSRFMGFEVPTYGISTATADVGTDVFVLGYPYVSEMGYEVKLTNGIISSKTGYKGNVSCYQISAPVQPGNSGGPLFDGNGNLIGIVNAGIPDADNVGYAIKLNYLRNLVESCNENIAFNYNNMIADLSLAEKVKKITPFVYIVKANMKTGQQNSIHSASTVSGGNDEQLAREYYHQAGQMMDDKRYHEAYELVKKSVEAYAFNENHFLRARLACYVMDEDSIAIVSAQYCVEKQYQINACYEILGDAYWGLEQWESAISIYDKLLSLDRKDVNALYMRGLCKSGMGNKMAAIADYRSALKFEGIVEFDYGTVYNNIAYSYLTIGDLINTQLNIEPALKRNHFTNYIWDTYGELAYKQGKYEDCVRYMGTAIVLTQNNNKEESDNSYYYRGLANKQLGFDADAIADLQRAKELGNEHADSALATFTTNNQMSGKFFNMYRTPKITTTTARTLKIKAIESTEESTILYFTCSYAGGGWIRMNKDSYLLEKETGNKLYLVDFENITLSPEKTTIGNEEHSFTLTFPALSKSCTSIDFIEPEDGGFRISGIILQDNFSSSETKETIYWEDVAVTDDPKYAEGLVAIGSFTKGSGWGGMAVNAGYKSAIKMLQQEAAKKGCCMIVITGYSAGFTTKVTATFYKRE